MATIQDLIAEAERISKGSILLSAASPSEKIVGWWGGKNPEWHNGRPDDRHRISVETAWLAQQGFRVGNVISVYDVAPRSRWVVPVQVEQLQGAELGRIDGAKPLAGHEAVSWPPLEALCLYGGGGVTEWLSSMNLDRTDYDDAAATGVGLAYEEFYRERLPLYRPDVAAVLGGWHALWPDDEFYIPREMRLVLWTLWDSEPWIEVFERFPNFPVRLRIA